MTVNWDKLTLLEQHAMCAQRVGPAAAAGTVPAVGAAGKHHAALPRAPPPAVQPGRVRRWAAGRHAPPRAALAACAAVWIDQGYVQPLTCAAMHPSQCCSLCTLKLPRHGFG